MLSKVNSLGAIPDRSSQGCCCGSSSNKQKAKTAEPPCEDAPVATRVENDIAIGTQTGACCGAR